MCHDMDLVKATHIDSYEWNLQKQLSFSKNKRLILTAAMAQQGVDRSLMFWGCCHFFFLLSLPRLRPFRSVFVSSVDLAPVNGCIISLATLG